jgi:hypothetical protein
MMYDQTEGGAQLRKYNGCNLAWWHTFKHTAMLIWSTFSCELFAPLWHHLYPGHYFYREPSSLPCVISHMLFLQMSRDAVITDLKVISTDTETGYQSKLMALDLIFILEIAIPVVTNCLINSTSHTCFDVCLCVM